MQDKGLRLFHAAILVIPKKKWFTKGFCLVPTGVACVSSAWIDCVNISSLVEPLALASDSVVPVCYAAVW